MNILAIGAHPDDIEVGCIGTLLKHIKNGDNVFMICTTQGGYGSRPWQLIEKEIECVKEKIQVDYIILDNPIGHIVQNWKTVSELDKIISDCDINTIYSVWYGDAHQDHKVTFNIALAAARKKIKNFMCYEISSYSNRSNEMFRPQLYVDISEFFHKKIEIISCYKSYMNEFHLRAVEGLAKHRGILLQYPYAEAFEIIFMSSEFIMR